MTSMLCRMTRGGPCVVQVANGLRPFTPPRREAIDTGRQIARNQGTELFVHGRDGRIR